MSPEDLKVYIEMHKENERLRLSFNERQERWEEYKKSKTPKRTETSFDMSKF